MGPRHRSRYEALEHRLCLAIESAVPSVYLDSNTDLMSQSAATAAAADGTSIAVYADRDASTGKGNDVWLRRFLANGSATAVSERVNTTTSGAQMNVDVAVFSATDYAVVWQSENQDGSGWGVYARLHNSGGWSNEILVNQTTAGAQVSPKIAMNSAAGFVVTWVGRDDNGGNGEIYARRFNASAGAATNEMLVSSGGSFGHTSPDVAINGGVAVVVWVASDLNDSAQTDISFRRLNATTLSALATAGTANTVITGDQAAPSITSLAALNDFAVVWSDTSVGSEAAIFGRRLDDAAATSFAQIQISQDSDGNRSRPQISSAGSTTVIGWTQQVVGSSAASTVVRAFDGNLNATTNEVATSDGVSARTLQGLAVTGNGRFREASTLGEFTGYGIASAAGFNNVLLLSGTSGNDTIVAYDLNGSTVRASVNGVSLNYVRNAYSNLRVDLGAGNDTLIANDASFAASVDGGAGNDTITATSAGDTLAGDDGDDWIYCGPGSDYAIGNSGIDRVWGEDGDDTLTGGAGKDTMWGGFGKDRLSGSGSPDCLFGEDDDDRLYGELGDDRCDGGGGKDRLYGDDGNDLLVGNASNDRIYAGAGNDTLNGGKGNDYLEGDDGIDTVLAKEPGDTLVEIEVS
jgi:Ca2+-binding RTX toxin-like protein